MAAATVGAEFAVMNIIGTMAAAAASIDRFDSVERRSVARIAGNFGVSAFKRKIGLYVVIECPDVPGDRVMAGVAAVIEIASMRVVFAMTGDAVGFDVRKNPCGLIGDGLGSVTVLAFVLSMLAQQGECREVMIEEYGIVPVDFGVTILALGTERFLVGILVEMT
jgi:hypothetical protein